MNGAARPDELPALSHIPSGAAAAWATGDATSPHEAAESQLLSPRAVAVRRRSFRLGRAAAHAALRELGVDAGPIGINEDRSPIWPHGIVGSIAHTSDVALALVAAADLTDGVGVDVEHRREVPELWSQVPRPEETAWLRRADNPDDALLGLFSMKEAIFKAFYPRVYRFFGFEAASVAPAGSAYTAHLTSGLDPDYTEEHRFTVRSAWQAETVVAWLILPKLGSGH